MPERSSFETSSVCTNYFLYHLLSCPSIYKLGIEVCTLFSPKFSYAILACVRAISSVAERFVDIEEVGGSNPPSPTKFTTGHSIEKRSGVRSFHRPLFKNEAQTFSLHFVFCICDPTGNDPAVTNLFTPRIRKNSKYCWTRLVVPPCVRDILCRFDSHESKALSRPARSRPVCFLSGHRQKWPNRNVGTHFCICDPTGNRTPISRMKTWRPGR